MGFSLPSIFGDFLYCLGLFGSAGVPSHALSVKVRAYVSKCDICLFSICVYCRCDLRVGPSYTLRHRGARVSVPTHGKNQPSYELEQSVLATGSSPTSEILDFFPVRDDRGRFFSYRDEFTLEDTVSRVFC